MKCWTRTNSLMVGSVSMVFFVTLLLNCIMKVVHAYQAESDVELDLSVGDFVVVRKVVCF